MKWETKGEKKLFDLESIDRHTGDCVVRGDSMILCTESYKLEESIFGHKYSLE